ncbi:scm-like with four MBT domains protein 1-like, partial [Scleropages formosus]
AHGQTGCALISSDGVMEGGERACVSHAEQGGRISSAPIFSVRCIRPERHRKQFKKSTLSSGGVTGTATQHSYKSLLIGDLQQPDSSNKRVLERGCSLTCEGLRVSDEGSGQDDSDFNWDEYLEECGASAVPHHAFKHVDLSLQTGLTPGMKLEVCVRGEPEGTYWVANIITTCGQLLLLRYEGYHDDRRADFWCDIMTADLHPVGWGKQQGRIMRPPEGVRERREDWEALLEKVLSEGCSAPANLLEGRWVFYLHPFLHPPGWAIENGCTLTPPAVLRGLRSEEEWNEVRQRIGAQPPDGAVTNELFKEKPTISAHCFTEGMKLEAVNPAAPFSISPATVTKVFSDQYFLVEMDVQGCVAAGPSFVCHCDSAGIFPTQWSLKNGVQLSPPPGYQGQDFDWADYLKQCGAEAAPQHCFPPVSVKQPVPDIIVHIDSMDIFPVSWCETNGYSLRYPTKPQGQGNGKYSCPKIYFNHRCFSGPYLNKGRIAELPQCVGPGSCVLVLKEVLTLLINAAYKPSRVLRELQLDEESRWQGHGETLKAKYKGKSYRATVEVVRTADQVAEFCRKTCIRLECCPNLFGPRMVLGRCSENCSVLTKTKYTHYYGKKKSKRIGRPPGGHTNLESGVRKVGKRRKRKKHFFVHKKKRSNSLDNTPAGSPQGSGEEEDLDEDDSLSEDSGSELQDELLDDSEHSERKSQPPSPTHNESPRTRRRRKRKTRSSSYSDDENQPPSPKGQRVEVPEKLQLDTSPLEWSVADVVHFIRTTDCAPLARIFLDQEIDGQALLLLTLPTVQECMGLKLGPAVKLCHHIERVKLAFYQQFAS